jgi:hypothetical protein
MRTKPSKHDNCECVIDTTHLNAHGMPAMKCVEHGAWICWISKQDQQQLLKMPEQYTLVQKELYERT